MDLHQAKMLVIHPEYYSQQEINEYYGILPREPTNPLFKLRSCVYALIALQRFIRKDH